VAIINTLDDLDSISITNLTYLTDRLRETAVNVLPSERFGVMTTESIVAFLGSMENTVRVCKESSCLAELGRQVSADYVSQGRIGRFDDNLTIKVELYSVKSGNLMGSFTGSSKNISGLLAVIDEKAADLFKRMLVEPKTKPSIQVEKPEFVKLELESVKPEIEKPKAEETKAEKSFFRTSFWVALGLDLMGAAIIYGGVFNNEQAKADYEYYKILGTDENYEKAWNDVEKAQKNRNMLYIIGGVVLASGVGVHIWF